VKSIDSNLGARLIIEVPELMLTRYQELLRELGALLKPKNIRLGVDHVGLNLASLQYLSALPIEYLKIDSSLTQVFNQENAEFLLNNLCNIAHVLDVQVIASYVESEALLNRLQSLEIDGLQGVAVSPVEYP
jgi:EAL domain-containing protein (putative c-di-GMP-specific phosphodiesterase class I)